MSWLQEVQEKILAEIRQQPTPQKQLREALLWRGFLALELGGRMFLARDAQRTDARDLSDLRRISGLTLAPIGGQPEYCAEIQWRVTGQTARRRVLTQILRLPSPQSMTGIFEHPDFGNNFPAAELDHGVALLVRSIQHRGVRTKISGHGNETGDGNGRCRLFVEFANEGATSAFRGWFDAALLPRLPDSALYTFRTGEFGEGEFTIGTKADDEMLAFQCFKAAQVLGRVAWDAVTAEF